MRGPCLCLLPAYLSGSLVHHSACHVPTAHRGLLHEACTDPHTLACFPAQRSNDDMSVCPGVRIEDMGHKMGWWVFTCVACSSAVTRLCLEGQVHSTRLAAVVMLAN